MQSSKNRNKKIVNEYRVKGQEQPFHQIFNSAQENKITIYEIEFLKSMSQKNYEATPQIQQTKNREQLSIFNDGRKYRTVYKFQKFSGFIDYIQKAKEQENLNKRLSFRSSNDQIQCFLSNKFNSFMRHQKQKVFVARSDFPVIEDFSKELKNIQNTNLKQEKMNSDLENKPIFLREERSCLEKIRQELKIK